jgi:hypothetical protein
MLLFVLYLVDIPAKFNSRKQFKSWINLLACPLVIIRPTLTRVTVFCYCLQFPMCYGMLLFLLLSNIILFLRIIYYLLSDSVSVTFIGYVYVIKVSHGRHLFNFIRRNIM